MIESPLLTAGLLWDSANALGFLALAGCLYLFLFVGSGQHSRAHQLLSYTIIAAAMGHVFLLWLFDQTIWHYADADMPHYMWAGFGALISLIATIVLALPRYRRYWHARYRDFQRWHYYLSGAIVGFSVWHIVGSGFYLSSIEGVLLVLLAVTVPLLHRLRFKVASKLNTAAIFSTIAVSALWVFARQF